ncbi:hypothetical protein [Longispora albida]|uniref:hypothetical protein n=1 Tax=Longispora albida TaxID=203523 RepID=UPI00036C6098|nr:hypothetical protein [Longispora albida]
MSAALSLSRIRSNVGVPWLAWVSGIVWAVSQTALAVLTIPLGSPGVFEVQCTFFTASQYLRHFGDLEARGLLGVYRSHLFIDGAHPLWYAVFATSLLALLANRARVTPRWDWILALPVASGLFDVLENSIQRVFLSDRAAITDGLATIGTLCSLAKWTLVAFYIGTAIAWAARGFRRPA